MYDFRKDIKLNKCNYMKTNPIDKNNVKRKKINGKYIYEQFYLIDFLDIKKDSYVISSFGRIFSLLSNIELTPNVDKRKNNYNSVILSDKNNKPKKYPLHVLVARAFIPKTPSDKRMNRIYVHHKNWDNDYNYYWNLEWRSPMEIIMIGKVQNDKEMEEDDIVKIICKLLEKDESVLEIFEIIDKKMSKNKISRIKYKEIYTNISSNYKF